MFVEFWDDDADKAKDMTDIEETVRIVDMREAFFQSTVTRFDGDFERRGAKEKIKLSGPTRPGKGGKGTVKQKAGRLHVFFKHEPVKFSEKFLKAYGDPESWIEASGVDVGSDEEGERASSDEEVEDVNDVLGL